jgi:DNA-binding NarL/FixJ family response regulator
VRRGASGKERHAVPDQPPVLDEELRRVDDPVGLPKDRVADVDTFLSALEDVVGGGTVLDPQVVAQLFARRRADDPVRRLTPREREVLGLIAEGHSNTAIARTLVVTPGAVEKHTQHIFAKLGLAQDEDQHRRVMATLAYLRN